MLTHLASRRAAPLRAATELVAFCIVEREGGPPSWIRCGTARLARDGSINVRLDALPLTGELHLRPAEGEILRPPAPLDLPSPTPDPLERAPSPLHS